MLKLWSGDVLKEEELPAEAEDLVRNAKAGAVVSASERGLIVKTGKDFLKINELQPEGKKRMKAEEFLRGNRIAVGAVLG